MSASFLSSLDVRVLDDCGPLPRLMLLEPLHYQSSILGTVVIPRFYTFNAASVPSGPLGALAGMSGINPTRGLRAACVHDYLVDTKVRPEVADAVYLESLGVCGVDEGTAEAMYAAVRAWSLMTAPRPPEDPPVGA